MARVAGTNIPDKKRAVIALTYVKGIGLTTSKKIMETLKIDEATRTSDLSEKQLVDIRANIEDNYTVEADLNRQVSGDIARLKEIKSYRGSRHLRGLPSRGQRTKTNARTKRGNKSTVGSGRAKAASKT